MVTGQGDGQHTQTVLIGKTLIVAAKRIGEHPFVTGPSWSGCSGALRSTLGQVTALKAPYAYTLPGR